MSNITSTSLEDRTSHCITPEDVRQAFDEMQLPHVIELDDGSVEVRIFLSSISNAFDTTTPVPLPYIELQPELVSLIHECLEALPKKKKVSLITILLPESETKNPVTTTFAELFIHRYITERVERHKRLERDALREMLRALFYGFGFMAACQIVRYLTQWVDFPTLAQTISEGLLVLGWVALWNPYDRWLFDWLPKRRKRQEIEKLIGVKVQIAALPPASNKLASLHAEH